MKKAPQGSYKELFLKDITMVKNIYKHFSPFDIGLKNGEGNNFLSCICTENCTGILLKGT